MGGIKFVPQLDIKKMKLSVALFAAAQASPTQWMVDQWWNEAVDVFNFSNNNWAAFSNAVDSVDDSQWQPLWNFCNNDGNDELSSAELISCGARAANYLGMPETHQNFLYQFASKYWGVVDQDGSGSLNYDEFRYTLGGFAATDARVVMWGFDQDKNGVLDSNELRAWKSYVRNELSGLGWNPSSDQQAQMMAAWSSAQNDGDDSTANMAEVAHFLIGA